MSLKLLTFLNSLEKNEWSKFRSYLLKEAMKSEELIRFFEHIYANRFAKLNDELINDLYLNGFSHLTRKSYFNQLSKIQKHLEKWMVLVEYEKDHHRQKIDLLKAYNKRGLYKEANKLFKKTEKELLPKSSQDLEGNALLYELYQAQFLSTNPVKNKEGTEMMDALFFAHTRAYKERSLQLISLLANWGQIKKENYVPKINLLKNSFESLDSTPLSLLLESLELMISEDNVDAYMQLKRWVINERRLDQDSLIHSVVISFLQVRFGRFWDKGLIKDSSVFYEITSYLFSYELEKKAMKIGRKTFTNIFQFIAMTSEFEIAHKFQKKWSAYVKADETEEFESFLNVINLFYNDKFDELLKVLPSTVGSDLAERIQLQRFELAALYKLRDEIPNVLYGRILNFKRFLNRNKSQISSRLMIATKNYISVFEKLNSYNFKPTQIDLDQYKFIAMRSWLTKQIKGVKN